MVKASLNLTKDRGNVFPLASAAFSISVVCDPCASVRLVNDPVVTCSGRCGATLVAIMMTETEVRARYARRVAIGTKWCRWDDEKNPPRIEVFVGHCDHICLGCYPYGFIARHSANSELA